MKEFDDRNEYAKLLRLLSVCDEAHMQIPFDEALMASSHAAVYEFLDAYGVDYADFDDAHFFETCKLIRTLQTEARLRSLGNVSETQQ